MRHRPPGRPRRVLLDTSAYFILTNRRDASHTAAVAARDRLIAERWHLFTTNFILAETHALLLSRVGRAVAARVLAEIDRSATTIIRASAADERRARDIIVQYDDKDFYLTDAISFAVMERLRIDVAFSFDRNFAQYGWQVLGPTPGK
jgi:predicted nucleic acid-binding protein